MKTKAIAGMILTLLLLSMTPIVIHVKPVAASPTGPSLIVDDVLNQIHATQGATAGSTITVKGTVTNVGGSPPAPWLTGVFYRENVGPGITPPDLTLLWSLDGSLWMPAGPVVWPTLYPGYQLELIVGAPSYYIPPGFNSTTYIKPIVNCLAGIGPTDVEVIVFEDWDGSISYTPGVDVIISTGDFPVKIDLSVWNTAELDPTFFDTIQGAVNNASTGDTIFVYPGTYAGAVVDKNVTISGAAGGASVITSGVPYRAGASLYTAFRLDAMADGAEIRNFAIKCNSSQSFYFAVFSRNADNVTVDSLVVNDAVQGITNWGGSNWQITNNVLNDTEAAGGGGIAIFLGAYPPSYTVCSGNLVENNTITATATAPDYTCPGISVSLDLRYGAYDDLTGNEDVSNNQILNNSITAPGALNGVGIETGVIGLEGNTTKIAAVLGTVHDNTIKDNTIDGADMGIYFYTVTNLTIQQNEIKNCNEGIHVKDGSDGNTISYNNIFGNTIGLNMSARAQVYNNTIEGGRAGIWLGPGPYSISTTIKGNTITDFVKAGIVSRGAKNIFIEGNTISTTVHDEAPNGIDIGTYSGTNGTVRENEVSGCSWKDFTGDYETSWSGSGILVIESGDSLEITRNIVHDCDVGMDIESDSMNITRNDVYSNIYGFVFWNAKPEVHCNNIYNNTQYGVYRTALGDLTGVLNAECNWWGDASGPYHNVTNTAGLGDRVSDNVDYAPWSDTRYPIVGDLNDDCIVSITDVVIAATAFGSRPGDWNWNPIADLNGDNIVNIVDLVRIGINFGKGCKCS